MSVAIYTLHPGVGQGNTSSGAVPKRKDGAEFSHLQQSLGQNRRTDFHGVLVPSNIDTSRAITFRAVMRQGDAGSGNVVLTIAAINKAAGLNRGDLPLLVLSPTVDGDIVNLPGIEGKEFELELTMSAAAVKAGDEILTSIRRLTDVFAGLVDVVRLDIEIPILEVSPDPQELANVRSQTDLLTQLVLKLEEIDFMLKYHADLD